MELRVDDITHVIQLSVAPVFLLTSIATMINAMNTRLSRIVDRDLPRVRSGLPALKERTVREGDHRVNDKIGGRILEKSRTAFIRDGNLQLLSLEFTKLDDGCLGINSKGKIRDLPISIRRETGLDAIHIFSIRNLRVVTLLCIPNGTIKDVIDGRMCDLTLGVEDVIECWPRKFLLGAKLAHHISIRVEDFVLGVRNITKLEEARKNLIEITITIRG